MAVKRDHKEVCNAFANLRQALGDSRMLDSLYQFIDTYKLADYVELIARDEDIYLSYDGEVDETRPYNDEDEEEKEDYSTRFCAFCKRVSELSGIENGFSHVVVMQSRKAVHEHCRGKKKEDIKPQIIDFDMPYFKGKEVCVFDDVVTTGKSYARFANLLEENGANVVGGMFLGKTFYKYK